MKTKARALTIVALLIISLVVCTVFADNDGVSILESNGEETSVSEALESETEMTEEATDEETQTDVQSESSSEEDETEIYSEAEAAEDVEDHTVYEDEIDNEDDLDDRAIDDIDESDSVLPQTGGTSNTALWIGIGCAAVIIIISIYYYIYICYNISFIIYYFSCTNYISFFKWRY